MRTAKIRQSAAVLATAATVLGLLSAGTTDAVAGGTGHGGHKGGHGGHGGGGGTCQMANGIKHVIDIQFDNVHLTRDNPNVPSDVEQMPHLYNFLKTNGVVMANTHDVLVHTATNFLANQTGLYPDRTGVTQSNSYSYYDSTGKTHTGESFTYWTDPIDDPSGAPTDTNYNMIYTANRADVPNNNNVNVPAPWVPYTRDGCNVGEVGMSNEVLENDNDISTVFGPGSPEAAEAASNPNKAQADYVGLAIHCAQGSSVCANGEPDVLPDEPGGYRGYRADFGNAQIQPAVSPGVPMQTLDGQTITDAYGNPGFPGFDSEVPNVSLGYAAKLLESGVQNVNVYLSDVHGDHTAANEGDMGPGEKTYEQQLHDYDTAFAAFMARLAKDGITTKNTLFSLNDDEGDHFSGSAPTPANCTGQNGNYCTYTTRSEVNVNLAGLMATERGNTTPFAIHSDPAPAVWLTGNPAPASSTARQFGRDLGALRFTNPLTGQTEPVAYQLADPVEEKILHFVSSDANRTPSLTAFSGEDSYVGSGAANCTQSCVYTSQGYAWNHGGLWPDMQTIWSGLAGPGVRRNQGVNHTLWTDQVDMRPTLLALTGLHDDYQLDGRVLTEVLQPSALPCALRQHSETVTRLGRVFKQLAAADGSFAMNTLTASTRGIESGSAGSDSTYTRIEQQLSQLGSQRDAITAQMSDLLLGAAFDNRPINERQARSLLAHGQQLLAAAQREAAGH